MLTDYVSRLAICKSNENSRVELWMLELLKHSDNARMILGKSFGPSLLSFEELVNWINAMLRQAQPASKKNKRSDRCSQSDGAVDGRHSLSEALSYESDTSVRRTTDPVSGAQRPKMSAGRSSGGSSAGSISNYYSSRRGPGGWIGIDLNDFELRTPLRVPMGKKERSRTMAERWKALTKR